MTSPTLDPDKKRGLPPEWLVFLVIVVDLIGFGIVLPILPFLAPKVGGDELDVAMVIAIYSVCAGLVAPFWGGLSDRLGRRSVLIICLLGGALSYVLLAFASTLWMLYAARALGGIMAGSLPVASALMADVSRPERRAKAMGLVGTAFGVGLILGPFIGGLLAGDDQSFVVPGLFAATMSLVSALLAGVLLDGKKPTDSRAVPAPPVANESMLGFLRRHRARLMVFQYLLHTSAVSAATYLSPLWLAATLDWGPKEVGFLFGVVGIGMILIQGVMMNWLTTRFGLLPVLATGAAVSATCLLGTILVTGELPQALILIGLFTGAICCGPVLNTIASMLPRDSERGRMMGATALSASAGRVVGPLATGAVLATAGYNGAWLLIAMPMFGVLLWSQTAGKRLCVKRGMAK